MVRHLDEILAQTDPFDLAQALERHAGSLSPERMRDLAAFARDRAGPYYREELAQVLRPDLSDEQLRKRFVRFLKSNLRAVVLFGSGFANDVLRECPAHRVAAIGEEAAPVSSSRAMVIAGTAVALLVLAAAGEHAVSAAKAAVAVPEPIPTQASVASAPLPRPAQRKLAVANTPAVANRPVIVSRAPVPAARAATLPPAWAPAAATVPVTQTPQPASVEPPLHRSLRNAQGVRHRIRDARGPVVTVAVSAPTPAAESSPIDVSDMPEAYNDATPLPQQSAAPVAAPASVSLSTPKPSPKPKSWLHRTLMHFDPFQPGAHIRIP